MEKRDLLLGVATRLFAARGLGGVSFKEIAAAAAVDPGLPAGIFGTEEDLYAIVLETQFSLYATRMEAVFQGNYLPVKKIELAAEAICALHRESPEFFPLFYRELLNPSRFFDPIVKKHIRHIAYLSDSNIAKGIQKKALKHGINPANATMIMLGMYHYHFLASQLHETLLPGNREDYCHQALKIFLAGLKEGE